MSKLEYKKLYKLLKNNSLIASSIAETLYAIEKIDIFLKQQLPDPLRQHVKPLNISGNRLVLMVDSPAWKSRLRFLLPELEKKLRAHSANAVTSISVKLIPNADSRQQTIRTRDVRMLSGPSRSAIAGLADSLEDSRLKDSLLRLARRNKNPGS